MIVAAPMTRTFTVDDVRDRWWHGWMKAEDVIEWLVEIGCVERVGDEYAVTDLGRDLSEQLTDFAREQLEIG